ncbi:MAG TPA: ATP-binding protein [Thermodesulfobacteriota bacterium]|nr:ATP-binding protein [Thermodesulfobacteriota bacterium]
MRQLGLRVEILFNILFLTAVAMLLLGIIAFKVTERFALQGEISGAKSKIAAFEALYSKNGDIQTGIDFLKNVLEPGAWGVISDGKQRSVFHTDSNRNGNPTDPTILHVMKTGRTVIDIEGYNLPPFSFYKGFKIASPLKNGQRREGVIFIYQPLFSLEKNIIVAQRLIAAWIILDLIVIALFGVYMLSRRVVKPVHELIKTTEEIAQGRFPSRVNLGGVKEINQLHKALKKMYDEIEHTKTKLRENIKALEESNKALLNTQRELIASEKLASLGKLSAGVAHEIGNPLSAIRSYAEVLKKGYVLQDEKRTQFLTSIDKEVGRINVIIRSLLDYSRPKSFELKRVNINGIVKDTVEMIKNQGLLKNIDFRLELSPEFAYINADVNQLSQVLINLILNAKDAIRQDGMIAVSSRKISDDRVEIEVKDNGIGIPDEIKDKIFDPFFTTKEPGKGTGLGLSVSQRIVQTFGGEIAVESEPGQGARFKVTFPGV